MKREEADFLHDLSGPLSAALLNLEGLSMTLMEGPELEAVKKSLELIDRVADMVRDRKKELCELG